LGAVFSKESTVILDAVLYENTMLGVNTVTQVDGAPHVDYFSFNNGSNEAFNYDRESHFADVWLQWYEDTDGDLNNLELVKATLMDAVFGGQNWSDEYIKVAEDGTTFVSSTASSSGVNDFSQSVDDSRAVINFLHESYGAAQIEAPISVGLSSETEEALVLPSAQDPSARVDVLSLAESSVKEDLVSSEDPEETQDIVELASVLTPTDYPAESSSGSCGCGHASQEEVPSTVFASNFVEVLMPAAEVVM
jgi:hypothetical protein